ncbi:MAG: hypothetical protein DSM106950_42820 [Stigonema ocellatum SAG 48.90 = DSM 106950]|nr:hypothetical protein [Stigonema ocellatum SAG 48.90 = DSM 106950]
MGCGERSLFKMRIGSWWRKRSAFGRIALENQDWVVVAVFVQAAFASLT